MKKILWGIVIGIGINFISEMLFPTNLSGILFNNLNDAIYAAAAAGRLPQSGAMLSYFLIYGVIISAIFLAEIFKRQENVRAEYNKLMEDKGKPLDVESRSTKNYKVLFIVAGSLLILIAGKNAFFFSFEYQLNIGFNQATNALSPFMEDETLKQIKSDWALMKGKEDFNAIKAELQEIGTNNNIKVPGLYTD